MKSNHFLCVVGFTALILVFCGTRAADSAVAAPASQLEPIAFLAGFEWEAKLPPKPDGTQASIIARFSWSENHRLIRINNSFVAGASTFPYVEGMYTWNPRKKSIVFIYVDAGGTLSEGTVTKTDGTLVHDFQVVDLAGKVSAYVARATPDGADAWTNEIFERKEGKLEPFIKVRYEKIKKK